MKTKLSKLCGKLKVIGNTKLKPGTVITLKGISDRFNGKVYVTGVQHQFSVDNWFTEIQFGWNSDWFYKNEDIIEQPSSGLVPGINGLHTGIVTQLEKDPDGNFRIKVKIPLIDDKEDGVWARVATLDAGKGRGSFFLPEVKDEVLLGFINDDPRQAVVLGMLHSKTNNAPVTATKDNNEKGFYTRNKMKLFFDDGKKSITMSTPKGKSIVINDDDGSIILKDELNNKITMNSSGISIESAKDIQLKATGQIKADGQLKIELTSSGQAVLKGKIVNIN
jgi:Rhs element Vgr protein